MEPIKLQKAGKVVFDIDGHVFEAKKPSISAITDYHSQMEDLGDKKDGRGQMTLSLKFLEDHGIPKEILQQLDSDGLEIVMQSLLTAKKKSSAPGT